LVDLDEYSFETASDGELYSRGWYAASLLTLIESPLPLGCRRYHMKRYNTYKIRNSTRGSNEGLSGTNKIHGTPIAGVAELRQGVS
jgi:hypothetical protein